MTIPPTEWFESNEFEAWWVMKLWRRKCVGFRKVMHFYLQVFNWKKDWKNAKTIYELPGSSKDMINFQEMSNFPYCNPCIVNALLCWSWEVKPALINSKLSGKWSSKDYMLPKLNTGWVFSDKIRDLLKLSTDQLLLQLMRVCKELLDDFRACSDWNNDEAGADFWQALWVVCQ